MYIDNYLKPKVSPSLHYAERTPALIVKTNEEIGKDNILGVYIPRLMFGLPIKDGAYEKTVSISTNKILNSKNKTIGATSIKIKNYVELMVSMNPNINMPRYVNGENVIVDFADHDLKSAYILPYSFGDTNRRKTDIITLFVNNFKEEGEEPQLHNIYALQLDTKNQMISLFTSNPNGEKGVYTFAINAKDGAILISDSGKRRILIKTDEDLITLMNEAKSEITMIDTVINMKADILNIDMVSEINMRTSRIYRRADNIETDATNDWEKVTNYHSEGNDYLREYNNQVARGSNYENYTSRFKVDSPISGFTQILTCNQFNIFPVAGSFPPIVTANVSPIGIARFGNPSTASLGLAVAAPTIVALNTISVLVDAIGLLHCIPPMLVQTISNMSSSITSKLVFG
jgi:competence protein ComGF